MISNYSKELISNRFLLEYDLENILERSEQDGIILQNSCYK